MRTKFLKIACIYAASLAALVSSCSTENDFLFENGYNSNEYEDSVSLNVDTNRFKINYSKFTQARLFPGLAGSASEEARLEGYKVNVDLNYEEILASDLRISTAPGAWQSTGMYAPAGELILIDVPMGVYGLKVQVGAHVVTSDNGIPFPQRDLVIFNRVNLFPGRNYVRNLYGGLVYIIPERPLGRIIELSFSGTLKAPSFKLGETTNEEWHEMLSKTTVPWFELEGRRIVFTMETAKLKKFPIADPQTLMETWDENIRRGYWDWTGMTEGNPDLKHRAPFNKWRIVHDVLFKDGVAQVSGYPVRARNNENYFKQAVTLEDARFYNWGTYHELGHNMQMNSTWNFSGNGEITNNLFNFKISKLHGAQSYKIAEVWNKAVPYINETKHTSNAAAVANINWHSMFVTGNKYNSGAHDIGLMMYAQILERYGYEFMTYIYKRARNARFTSSNDQSKIDFFYEALSEYTNIDMSLYLAKWGLYPSAVSVKYVSGKPADGGLGLAPLDYDVWNFNPVTRTGGNAFIISKIATFGWAAIANSADGSRPAQNILDGNPATMWHPCTLTGSSSTCPGSEKTPAAGNPYTWIINIDTKNSVSAKGFVLTQRQASGTNLNHLKAVRIEVSDDNVSWRNLGRFSELLVGADFAGKEQVHYFNSQRLPLNFRYARLSINRGDDVNGDPNAVIADFVFFN